MNAAVRRWGETNYSVVTVTSGPERGANGGACGLSNEIRFLLEQARTAQDVWAGGADVPPKQGTKTLQSFGMLHVMFLGRPGRGSNEDVSLPAALQHGSSGGKSKPKRHASASGGDDPA
jgi:hypothetical protein